jgi:hypothetical protein
MKKTAEEKHGVENLWEECPYRLEELAKGDKVAANLMPQGKSATIAARRATSQRIVGPKGEEGKVRGRGAGKDQIEQVVLTKPPRTF